MYYGNSSVLSESDGKATFEFFDGFEEDTIVGEGLTQSSSFGEDGVYLQGVASDGTYLYHTHTGTWDGKKGKLVKCDKNGNVISTKTGLYDEDGPLTGAVSALCYHDGYLYLVGFGSPNGGSGVTNQSVAKYDPSDLSFVEEYDISPFDGSNAEGIAFYDNHWWLTSHENSVIVKYDTNWSYVKTYDIEGHGDAEGQFENGNGYQDITFWEESDGRVFAGLTVHSSCDHGPALYIFQYDKNNDSFTLYKKHTSGDIVPDQGWCCDSPLDPSETWWAVRHSAKIAKSLTLSNLVKEGWKIGGSNSGRTYSRITDPAIDNYALEIYGGGGSNVAGQDVWAERDVSSLNLNTYVFECKALFHSGADNDLSYWGVGGDYITDNNLKKALIIGTYPKSPANFYANYDDYDSGVARDYDNWHDIKIAVSSSTVYFYIDSDSPFHSESRSTIGVGGAYGDSLLKTVILASGYPDNKPVIDNVRIRKYASPEPSVSIGSENVRITFSSYPEGASIEVIK